MSPGVVRRLLVLLRGQRVLVAVSVVCRVVNHGLGVAIPASAVAFIPSVANRTLGLGTAVLALTVLALVKGMFRYLEQYTGHAVAFRLLADLRNRVFRWLERLEPGRLQDERSGDLVARVSGDIDRVEPFYAHTIAPAIAAVVVPTLALVALGALAGAGVALALALFVVAYLAVVPWIGARTATHIGPQARQLAGDAAAAVADTVQGAREVAVLEAGDRVVGRIAESDETRAKVEDGLARAAATRSLLGGLIAGGSIVSVAVIGVANGLGFQTLAISLVVAWTIWATVRSLEQVVPDTEQSLAAASRLFALEDLDSQSSGDAGSPKSGEVRFEVVTVRSGSKTLVDSLDLSVPSGTFLGVVGPSGSGKTTLIHALLRHRDPEAGRVWLGGTQVGDLSPQALAESISVVPQRPAIFAGTIATNLRIAHPGAGDSDLREALARVRLLEWVDGLELGLDTPVGERGVGMSGGQIQRLALARVLLRDPSVLVLDEATSELDAPTEQAILDEVHSERSGRTLIVVAHRLETMVDADVIAVMDRGRLVELGSHDELRQRGGLYAALWERHLDMLSL